MLANALVCSDLKSITRNFGSIVFYFDTPLVLRLLNIEGDAKAHACAELVELLQKLKGHCAIFDHTFEETKSVIDSDERNLDNPAVRGRVIEEMRRRGTTKSDLQLLSARLEERLKGKGIGRRRTPPYQRNRRFQIDEALLENSIRDEIDYMNPRALEYDINSIRSVYALREGKAPGRLEDAGAVLVTSNSGLARATFDYGREHESTREVSAVITDFSLANVAWLKAPLQAPDLPEIEIMASCYAALEPPAPLWNRYVTEVDKLKSLGNISADDHQVLRYSQPARSALMNLTGGSEHAFSANTITEIMARMKADLRAELSVERDQLLQEEKAKLAAAAEDHLLARQNYETAAVEAERGRVDAQTHADRLTQQRRDTELRIDTFATGIGRHVRRITIAILGTVAVITIAVETFKADSLEQRLARIIVPVLVVGGLLTYLHVVHGLSVKELSERFEHWVQRNLKRLLRRYFTDEGERHGTTGPSEF